MERIERRRMEFGEQQSTHFWLDVRRRGGIAHHAAGCELRRSGGRQSAASDTIHAEPHAELRCLARAPCGRTWNLQQRQRSDSRADTDFAGDTTNFLHIFGTFRANLSPESKCGYFRVRQFSASNSDSHGDEAIRDYSRG